MQEFARELILLVDAMGRIYALEHRTGRRSDILKWFSCLRPRPRRSASTLSSKAKHSTLRRRLCTIPTIHCDLYSHINSILTAILVPIESNERKIPKFPKVKPHAPNTVQTPSRASLSVAGRLKQSFWELGARLKEPDLKYAFKAGVATAMLASPAFFDSTRRWFVEYRGEWALVSVWLLSDPSHP